MKLNTLMRPSMLPTAVCALPENALSENALPENALLVNAPAPAAPSAPLAAERVWAPQVHQVLVQDELGKTALVLTGGNQGTSGFDVTISKRYTDGGSGVPPRGRPV